MPYLCGLRRFANAYEYILNERSAAYDDKCKYPCSYRKDFEQLKNDK